MYLHRADAPDTDVAHAARLAEHAARGHSAERQAPRPGSVATASRGASLSVGDLVRSRLAVLNGPNPGPGIPGAPLDPVNIYHAVVSVLTLPFRGPMPPSPGQLRR